jgi:hypothetical protein
MEESEYANDEHNSFLLNDQLIQMKLRSTEMHISIKDLEGNEIKTLDAFAEQEIPFKNSEIIQENGKISNTRILDKSNQLLRKIYNLNPSISCYRLNDKTYLTLGSVSMEQNNNAMMYGGMIGGFTGALIATAISSNYSVNNLNSYKDRKVVYINCLFDSNFNHIDGAIKRLAFDELRAFDEKKGLTYETVFKFNNALFFGGYNGANYSFYKFND